MLFRIGFLLFIVGIKVAELILGSYLLIQIKNVYNLRSPNDDGTRIYITFTHPPLENETALFTVEESFADEKFARSLENPFSSDDDSERLKQEEQRKKYLDKYMLLYHHVLTFVGKKKSMTPGKYYSSNFSKKEDFIYLDMRFSYVHSLFGQILITILHIEEISFPIRL